MAEKRNIVALTEQVWLEKKSKDLGAAIYDDWKRQAIDNAKKRAVAQNVDYPTFANLVSVAHLKPVDRKAYGQNDEDQPQHFCNGTTPAWSFGPTGTSSPQIHTQSLLDDGGDKLATGAVNLGQAMLEPSPKHLHGRISQDTFVKKWRQLSIDLILRVNYLISIEPNEYPEIFKVEIPPHLLGDILTTICTCFKADNPYGSPEHARLLQEACSRRFDEAWVTEMLEILPKCGRFSLAVALLGEKPRNMVRTLIAHLYDTTWCQLAEVMNKERLHNLEILYQLD